jgi:hypothetical protein
MADWDQAQLEDAIAKKEKGNQNRATDIVRFVQTRVVALVCSFLP